MNRPHHMYTCNVGSVEHLLIAKLGEGNITGILTYSFKGAALLLSTIWSACLSKTHFTPNTTPFILDLLLSIIQRIYVEATVCVEVRSPSIHQGFEAIGSARANANLDDRYGEEMGRETINVLSNGANLGVGESLVRVETHKRCGNDEELLGADTIRIGILESAASVSESFMANSPLPRKLGGWSFVAMFKQ